MSSALIPTTTIKKVPIMFAKLRKRVLCRWLGDGTAVVDWCTYYDDVTAFDAV